MCEYFYFYFFSLLLACLLAAGRVLCSHACASTERLVEQSLAGKQLVDAHAAPLSKPSDAVLAEKGWVGTGEKEELLGWAAGRKGFSIGVLYSFLAYLRFVELRSYML